MNSGLNESEEMSNAEALQAARDYLMANGWCKGSLYEGDVMEAHPGASACGWGAIDAVVQDTDVLWPLLDRVAFVLFPERSFEKVRPDVPSFPVFNDDPDTTFNDVLAVFDEAIRVAKEGLDVW